MWEDYCLYRNEGKGDGKRGHITSSWLILIVITKISFGIVCMDKSKKSRESNVEYIMMGAVTLEYLHIKSI